MATFFVYMLYMLAATIFCILRYYGFIVFISKLLIGVSRLGGMHAEIVLVTNIQDEKF